MKRVILLAICLLFVLFTYSETIIVNTMETSDLSDSIQLFYRTYIINILDDSKVDSILSKYCTKELKDYVQSIDEYDFISGGWFSAIKPDSLNVTKRNDKYIVTFKVSQYPISDKLATDSLYILVNQEQKISHIIRPCDNYKVPNDD